MNNDYVLLGPHVFVTKLAGFEHSEYIQNNETRLRQEESDVPLVQGKNIRNGFFVHEFDWYIKKERSDYLIRSKLTKPCLLIPYVGSNLGEVGIFYHEYDCHLASNIAKIELLDNHFDLEFLKYYLQSKVGQAYLFQSKQGSAQPNITMEAIRNTFVVDLPFPTQQQISDVLKTIDDKINNNLAISNDLEAMAKLLYDYWFVQFDYPDENGKPYKSSGGKMVWNDELKREIPEGWEVVSFGDILSFVKGRIPDELSDVSTDIYTTPYITIDVANNGQPQYCNPKTMVQCNGEVIMVMDGAASGDVYLGNKGSLGSTFSMLPSKRADISNAMIYMLLKANMPIYKKANTGSTVPHANRSFIEKMKIILPNNVSSISKQFDLLYEKVVTARIENQQLASLRDFLLPMLMNGQVKVGKEALQ